MPAINKIKSEKLYNALCLTLSERIHQVDWNSFTDEDWSNFSRMAVTEGVAPLIHWNFKDEDISGYSIPTRVKDFLANEYYNTTAQNQVMFQELEKILEALNTAGIPVIVLKGAAMAATFYPEIGLRPMGDVDLLIQEQYYSTARQILRSLGYIEEPVISYRLKKKIGFNLHFWRETEPKIKVELHWGLVGGQDTWYHPNVEWFWDQSEFNEPKIGSHFLTPTAHILYLIAHLYLQHGIDYSKLIWFYDLNLLINQHNNSINWIEMKKRALEYSWLEALYTVFIIIEDYFNLSIRTPITNEIGTTTIKPKSALIKNRSHIKRGYAIRQRLVSMNWSSRILWMSAKIFPNPSFMKWHYKPDPEWLFPIYYPYRWFEKLFKI